MENQPGPKVAIVSSKELGTNCWSSFRFIQGLRCPRVFTCKYPGKKTCRAVDTELEYLMQEKEHQVERIDAKVDQLLKERRK